MRKIVFILTLLPFLLRSQQLFIGQNALVHVSNGATLEVGGDLENAGAIQNLGTISLYGNWPINNNFNGLDGALKFLGGENQTISPPQLTVRELVVNQGGAVSFPGDEYVVTDRIDFQFGDIEIGPSTRFVLGENARVIGGSNDSYFAGTLISRGSGIKKFPVGDNGVYAPVTLLNVFGVGSEITASFNSPNTMNPIPADSILGVSNRGLWEVELVNGGTDPTPIEIEFNQEDLTNFVNRNNIRHRVNSPVITYSNTPGGIFGSLGVAELLDTDSVTYGTITGELDIQPQIGQKIYLAIGLAPRIPTEGLFFIPEAFSPNATDPDNQAFRIFGENIEEEDFFLTIYNKLGVEVYSTTSFEEANKIGWDGTNQATGAEEPTGVYYYSTRFKFVSGLITEKNGAFYLVK